MLPVYGDKCLSSVWSTETTGSKQFADGDDFQP